MRLGLNVGYWGLGLTVEQQLGLVKDAEAAGFDSVWAAEAYGSDTATVWPGSPAQTERSSSARRSSRCRPARRR